MRENPADLQSVALDRSATTLLSEKKGIEPLQHV